MAASFDGSFSLLRRRTVLSAFLACLCLVPMGAGQTVRADEPNTRDPAAERFISDLAVETLRRISAPNMTTKEQQAVFRSLLVANTDMRRFGRSALGRYSRVPSAEEFEEYLTALEDYAVAVLTSRFALFTDHKIKVAGSQVRPGRSTRYVIVGTNLQDPLGDEVALIQWVLIQNEDQYRIFDIVLQTPGEGGSFSMLKTQRDEFTQVMRANNRDTQKLIAHLRRGVMRASGEPPAAPAQ